MEYKVIKNYNETDLADEVNKHLGWGWELVGSHTLNIKQINQFNRASENIEIYCQTMTHK